MSWRNIAYGSQSAAEEAKLVPSNASSVQSEVPKSAIGKVYRILEFLRQVPSHAFVESSQILRQTGVDLHADAELQQRLETNPKIKIQNKSTGAVLYGYQAKYNIKSVFELVQILDRVPEGIPHDDLCDCYVGVLDDLQRLTHQGRIITIKNTETTLNVYYPRGDLFLAELSAVSCGLSMGEYVSRVDKPLTQEIRRGDAILVGANHWCRVSAALKTSASSGSNPPPPMSGMTTTKSVTSTRAPNITKKVRYLLKFDDEHLPMDAPFPGDINHSFVKRPRIGNRLSLKKHGCTNDIRTLWNDTLKSWPSDDVEFERHLVQAGLTTQEMLDAGKRQKKPRFGGKKKGPRKPRAQRNIKLSNQHLIGTELGDLLSKGSEGAGSLGAARFEKS